MIAKPQLPSWKPRSFQKTGIKTCIGQACAGLLFPPGGGKTSTMYMTFRILQDKGYVQKMLVVCPMRPMYRVWPHQKDKYAEFQHLRVAVLHGKDKEDLLWSDDYDIYVVNPEAMEWLFQPDAKTNKPDPVRLAKLAKKFQMLCVDESTKFKNSQTKRFKLLRNIVPKFKRRYILTGTPTPRGLLDLFGQIYILDEGQSLGRYITHYRNNYFMPSGYGGYDWKIMPGADKVIAERIAPLVVRVDLKDAGIDLPEIVFDDIWVDLPPAARKVYNTMYDDLIAALDSGTVVAANAAVASGKCRQIANGMLIDTETKQWRPLHDEKLNALEDLVEQLQGSPLLITHEFVPDSQRIKALFKDIETLSSGNAKKDDMVAQKFSLGLLPYVMGSPQSISLGIDGLQDNCHHIAMFGVTWNLQDYMQVIDRVRRQGNKSSHVIVHRILARNTIDERVLDVLDDRDADQESFMKLLKSLRR